jgi:hypothetical protein
VTAKRSTPRVPAGLGAAGKALWKSILSDLDEGWELENRELHFLRRAARCEDELVALEKIVDRDGETTEGSRGQTIVHPALGEGRQLRLVQLRLLSALELQDPASARTGATPASKLARRAAESRWGRNEHRGAA